MRDVLRRGTGALALAGGALVTVYAGASSASPPGCLSEGCLTHPEDIRGDVTWQLGVLGAGLLALALAAVGLLLIAVRTHRAGWWAALPAPLALVSTGVIAFGGAVTPSPAHMSRVFLVPGLAGLALSVFLAVVVVLRAKVLPGHVSGALVLGTVVLPAASDADWRVLLVTPFAFGWALVGVTLLMEVHRELLPRHRLRAL